MLTSIAIKAKAREIGFDLCGMAPADSFPELAFLREWLDRGYAGEMAYMARSADRRADVRAVVPGARSVIVTGTIYNTVRHMRSAPADDVALISRYAWGDDYHDVLKTRLDALLAWMRARVAGAIRRACVRGYRSGAGARLRAVRRPRLDRQEHVPDQPGARIVAVSGARSSARCRSSRTLRGSSSAVRARAASTRVRPARWSSPACSMPPVPVVPDDRAATRYSRRVSCRRSAHTYTAATSARRSARTTRRRRSQMTRRGSRGRARLAAARGSVAAARRRTARADKGSAMTRAKLTGLRRNLAVAIGNSRDADAVAALDEERRIDHRRRSDRPRARDVGARRQSR